MIFRQSSGFIMRVYRCQRSRKVLMKEGRVPENCFLLQLQTCSGGPPCQAPFGLVLHTMNFRNSACEVHTTHMLPPTESGERTSWPHTCRGIQANITEMIDVTEMLGIAKLKIYRQEMRPSEIACSDGKTT